MFVGMTLVCLIGDGVVHVWLDNCRRGFTMALSMGPSVLFGYGMIYFNHQIPESESGNTVHA